MNKFIKERLFKEKIIKTISLCNEELAKRKKGVAGESTVEELNIVLTDLKVLLERVNNHQYPPKEERYLLSFAYAFKEWCWSMQEPTGIFDLLAQLNTEYKDLG